MASTILYSNKELSVLMVNPVFMKKYMYGFDILENGLFKRMLISESIKINKESKLVKKLLKDDAVRAEFVNVAFSDLNDTKKSELLGVTERTWYRMKNDYLRVIA
jgi:hypothetical protein